MYVPLNVPVFIAALAGTLAGIAGGGRTPVDPVPADDSATSAVAAAFAEAVDQAWGVGAADSLETATIQSICQSTWAQRSQPPASGAFLTASTYAVPAAGLVAEVLALDAWYMANVGPVPAGGLFLGVAAPITYAAGIVGITTASAILAGAVSTGAQTFGGTKTFANGAILASLTSLSQTQGGTLLAPTIETPLSFQPRDPAKPPFTAVQTWALFNTTIDAVFSWGSNAEGVNPAKPTAEWVIEEDYEVVPGVHWFEMYTQIHQAGFANLARPFYANYDKATGNVTTLISSYGAGATNIVSNGTTIAYWNVNQTQLTSAFFGVAVNAVVGQGFQIRSMAGVPLLLLDQQKNWVFGAAVVTPSIGQLIAAAGAGTSLSLTAQAAAVASGANGGDLILSGGAKDGAGIAGIVKTLNPAGRTLSLDTQITFDNGNATAAVLVATKTGTGQNLTLQAGSSSTADGGFLNLQGGSQAAAGHMGGVRLQLNATDTSTLVEIAEVITNNRILSLCHRTIVAAADLPAGCGDGTIAVFDAATDVTASCVNGFMLQSQGGVPFVRTGAGNRLLLSLVNAATATAGGGQIALGTVLGYLTATYNGTVIKIPYFAN